MVLQDAHIRSVDKDRPGEDDRRPPIETNRGWPSQPPTSVEHAYTRQIRNGADALSALTLCGLPYDDTQGGTEPCRLCATQEQGREVEFSEQRPKKRAASPHQKLLEIYRFCPPDTFSCARTYLGARS